MTPLIDQSQATRASRAPAVLRVMPEYVSTGLWHARRSGPDAGRGPVRECDPAALGLSGALCARLERWCARYEVLGFGLPDSSPDVASFATEGLAIAQALQAEMPLDEVWYFDEALCDQGSSRLDYLYPVARRT